MEYGWILLIPYLFLYFSFGFGSDTDIFKCVAYMTLMVIDIICIQLWILRYGSNTEYPDSNMDRILTFLNGFGLIYKQIISIPFTTLATPIPWQQLSVDPALNLNAEDVVGRELRLWPASETKIQTACHLWGSCIAWSAAMCVWTWLASHRDGT